MTLLVYLLYLISVSVYGPVQSYDCFLMGSVYVYTLYTHVHLFHINYVKEVVSFQRLSELLGKVYKLTHTGAIV